MYRYHEYILGKTELPVDYFLIGYNDVCHLIQRQLDKSLVIRIIMTKGEVISCRLINIINE